MSQKVIVGTAKLAETIKRRRQELNLTIEEAAARAGVGMKTWCRYEAGESIRRDKAKGICKALSWQTIPNDTTTDASEFDFDEYINHYAWSRYICDCYGEAAAISFVIGSDVLLDYLKEDLDLLSKMPRGTHIGQLPISMTKDLLPEQFLMRYDYELLYRLITTIKALREAAHRGNEFCAHSVIEEIILYLILEESKFLMEVMRDEMEDCGIEGLDDWEEWAFDLFDDMDVFTYLYSDAYITEDNCYHFDHWGDWQFYAD